MRALEDVLMDMVENSGRTLTAISAEIGKHKSTLSRELSPYDSGAKLGVESLVPLMRACNSVAPLEAIAGFMGYGLRPLGGAPDGLNMEDECLQGYEAVTDFTRAARAGAHYTDLMPKLRAAIKELEDVLVRARERDQ